MTPSDKQRLRDRHLYRYVQALDRADPDALANVLEAALDDPDLSTAIEEIHQAVLEEAEASIETAGQTVARLAEHHLGAAARQQNRQEASLTLGDVAAHLKAQRRVSAAATVANDRLIQNTHPLPLGLTVPMLRRLLAEQDIELDKVHLRALRDAALELSRISSATSYRLAARKENRPKQ